MKKMITILLATLLLLSVTACSAPVQTIAPTQTPAETPAPTPVPTGDPLDANATPEVSAEPEVSTEPELSAEPEVSAEPEASAEPEQGARELVVYFSATGTTRAAAEALAQLQGADIYEIVPEQPYTDADLNYNDRSTRATVEQNDASARPAIGGEAVDVSGYDVVYVGYPIWWGDMPRILYTFFDANDLAGKTIAPFCTSGGSGISRSVQAIGDLEPDADVTEGLKVDSHDEFAGWLDDIGLAQ